MNDFGIMQKGEDLLSSDVLWDYAGSVNCCGGIEIYDCILVDMQKLTPDRVYKKPSWACRCVMASSWKTTTATKSR